MAVNTEFLGSGLTTQFTGSDVSFAGAAVFRSTVSVVGAATLGAITATTVAPSTSATIGGGTAITKISSSTIGVVALTLTAQTSTETTATFSGATTTGTPQAFVVTPQSALSAGVIVSAYPSSTNQITLRYSNMTVQQAQIAHTVRVVMLQF